jgi:hypothetical protein
MNQQLRHLRVDDGDFMNRCRQIATACLMAILFPFACLGQSKTSFTLSISTNTPTVKKGAELRLDLTVANLSDHPITVYEDGHGYAEAANEIEVRDASGALLHRIDSPLMSIHGTPVRLPKQWVSRKGTSLNPGERLDDFSILSNLFDLSKPGKYRVIAKQWIHNDPGSTETWTGATSNSVDITVVD